MQIHQNTQSRAKAMSHNDECAATNMLTSQQTQLAHASTLLIFLFCLTNAVLCNITAPLLHYKRAINGGFIASLFGLPDDVIECII